VQNTMVWLRNGVPIDLATSPSYVVQAADVGAALTVRYTGRVAGRADGVVDSTAVTGLAGDAAPTPITYPTPTVNPTPTPTPTPGPTPVASSTRLKAPKTAAAGKRIAMTVTVRAAGISSPTGVVKIFAGKKLMAKVTLKPGSSGVTKVRLASLKKGRYVLRAVYSGGTGVTGSSTTRKLLMV